MIPGIFIAGTGTDVGKTVVTAGVLRWLRSRSRNAIVMKPVQTGAQVTPDGRMVAPDVDFVLRAANISVDSETLARLSPYLFGPACSPHLAARLAGRRIEIDRILTGARWLAARYDSLVVESAGGIAVPLNESQMMLDLALEMRMPVLLVGHSGLGTINHVLLSVEALRNRGCKVLGVILNDAKPVNVSDAYIHADNVCSIEAFGRVRNVVRIPYLGDPLDIAALDAALGDCGFLEGCAA